MGRMNDWTRYRMGRVLRILLVLSVLSFVLGRIYHVSPAVALFKLPAAVYKAMPLVLQLGFALIRWLQRALGSHMTRRQAST